jgi:hypothetical protein
MEERVERNKTREVREERIILKGEGLTSRVEVREVVQVKLRRRTSVKELEIEVELR